MAGEQASGTSSTDEAVGLLGVKAPGFRCSACDNKKFAYIGRGLRDGVETLSVACTNCGKIEGFAVQLLMGDYPKDMSHG